MRILNLVWSLTLLAGVLAMPTTVFASSQQYQTCMLSEIDSAADSLTVGALRAICTSADDTQISIVTERLEQDRKNTLEPFTILSHKPNYLLLANYNSNGYQDSFDDNFTETNDRHLDNTEAHFQLSLKVPLEANLFNRNIDLYGAYTVRSFWQVYNTEESSPFRETNHEPEFWLQAYPKWSLFGLKNSIVMLGIAHQSNGRSEPISRSWNRVYADFIFEKQNFVLSVKPWFRISEDSDEDDNPDITDFLGHYELRALYKSRSGHQFSLMSRNNIESGFDRGAIEAGWSFPLGRWPYLRGYVQYFRGYGESLLDYNEKANSIGIGIMLK
ncbi:MAG: phospholipase A1 [Chitinophagales bacterium]|jgi:phospholipase A1